MDPSNADRRHLSWRDLPATPPIELRASAAAPGPETTQPIAPLSDVPRARARRRTTVAAGLVVGAVLLVGAGLAVGTVAGGRGSDTPAGPQGLFGGSGPLASPAAGATDGDAGAPGGTRGTPAPGTAEDGSVADAAAQLLPSVVQIETSSGLGSGFVADQAGYVLTASHVVGAQSSVTVRLKDGTTVPGDVVAADSSIDTAVVKVAREDLPVAALGSSADVRVGETAIAVGSPFGFDQTVTKGIISGLDRTLDTEVGQLTGLIQTDAPINQGNSGGPLADTSARVIGINTAIASQSGGSNGVGFAVPIDTAKALLQKVKDGTWTAADNKPFSGGGLIPGIGSIPGLGDIPDLNQLFGQGGPLSPDGLFGPNGLFGTPDPANPDGTTPNGSDQTEQLFRWFFNHVMPELVPGSGSGGN